MQHIIEVPVEVLKEGFYQAEVIAISPFASVMKSPEHDLIISARIAGKRVLVSLDPAEFARSVVASLRDGSLPA